MTGRRTFQKRENWNVSALAGDVRATSIVIGVMAVSWPIPFNISSCGTEHDAMLSSRQSSHRPVPFIDPMPFDRTTGHDGDVCIAMCFADRRPVLRSPDYD